MTLELTALALAKPAPFSPLCGGMGRGAARARPVGCAFIAHHPHDHRTVDGKGAVTFLLRVKEPLKDPRRLLMDL